MAAKFELKKSSNGKFMFSLKAGNGQVVITSEMYNTKKAAQNGIASIGKNAANDGRFERNTAKNGKAYFILKASNGQAIGKSQMYASVASMENGIASVKKNAGAEVADKTED